MKLVEEKSFGVTRLRILDPLSREIHTSFEGLAPMQEEWDRFVDKAGGGIYFSFDWCRIWWHHYGRGRTLQIFLYRTGKKLEGLIPVFIDRVRFGPVKLRIAKIVGSEFACTLCNPPLLPEYAGPIWESLIDHLVHKHHCDALWFGPLAGAEENTEELRKVCLRRPGVTKIMRDTSFAPHISFILPKTFEEYLNSLDKRQRTNFRRDMNLLNRDFRLTVDTIGDPARVETEFMQFKFMHDRQWQDQGKLGHFGDWPGAPAFNLDLVKTMARKGRLRMIRLLANDQVVSYQLCYRFGDSLYWRLPARVIGPEWERYGLGRIGLIKMIEWAITEKVRYIEAGIGHYDYKIKLGGIERPLRSILIAADQKSSRLKTHLFSKMGEALHFFYYRLWFNRLAPRLPFKRRPLWKTWIRSRL
jgi:CelD/BcsL family acetyltransferase involved in cellulose biosynthesis